MADPTHEWWDDQTTPDERDGIGPIESIFNRGPVAMAGGSTQVNRASWDMEEPYHVYHIASQ